MSYPHEFPFDDKIVPYRVEPMRLTDLQQVIKIENEVFPAPWSISTYRYELIQNDQATYLVLKLRQNRTILSYGGTHLDNGKTHLCTLATHPSWLRQGLGEMLLVALIDAATLQGATRITLEVRVSNTIAQNLYKKYHFVQVGRHKQYYSDNKEDAILMAIPWLNDLDFVCDYADLKYALRQKIMEQDK